MSKKKKVTEVFLRLSLPPPKVDDADADDDDGRVGIHNAEGTAEQKTWIMKGSFAKYINTFCITFPLTGHL